MRPELSAERSGVNADKSEISREALKQWCLKVCGRFRVFSLILVKTSNLKTKPKLFRKMSMVKQTRENDDNWFIYL